MAITIVSGSSFPYINPPVYSMHICHLALLGIHHRILLRDQQRATLKLHKAEDTMRHHPIHGSYRLEVLLQANCSRQNQILD